MKVLIVEDEAKAGDYLHQGLTENGFVVDLARNGVDGLHLAATGDYDVIVLDVMLPGMDGWSVLRELRKAKDTPVIFLTARDEVEDESKGWSSVRTTIWSNPSPFPNCLPACAPCCDAAGIRKRTFCASPTWSSTRCGARWHGAPPGSISPPKNLHCCIC